MKQQMKRIGPKFNEKGLEFSSFMEFVASFSEIVEVNRGTGADADAALIRLLPC